ncbi:Sel1-like repeat [Roseobacter sp. AzwK-3b]|uniref:tetratricopeptide repeat protein n=1 Tax=Roseobacter sp. AzwK-3b TaxID=351016 RepID=UPI0001568F92|nr:tetratricopeptide repeat protein [Roseobacter sp. AzwK-3b]EDM72544.1 Sel1-like repeat [Roseobacter sp. AzwK-3b]
MTSAVRIWVVALLMSLSLLGCASIQEVQNDRAIAAYKAEDFGSALAIWSRLAEQGNARAQNNLGVMYSLGMGVKQDKELAMTWFRKSAVQGYALAQANIADSYYNGDGAPQDYQEAARWYTLAALAGDNEAQFYMGEMSAKGLGMPSDPVRAFVWYSFSADNGYENAVPALATLSAKLNEDQLNQANLLLAECKATGLDAC